MGASGNFCHLPSFVDDTVAKTGRSARVIRLDATRGKSIAPDVLKDVIGTAEDTSRTLDKLAQIAPDKQAAALIEMRADAALPLANRG